MQNGLPIAIFAAQICLNKMLHLFSFLNILIASVIFSFSFPGATTPSEDYRISSMDGEFTTFQPPPAARCLRSLELWQVAAA